MSTEFASAAPAPARAPLPAAVAPVAARLPAAPVVVHQAPVVRSAAAPVQTVVTHRVVSAARPTTYTVQPGDCLWSIGQRYGISMYALAQANGMSLSDVLYAGRTLTLPAPGTAVSTPVQTTAEQSSTTDPSTTYRHSYGSYGHSSSSYRQSSSSYRSSSNSVSAGSGLEQCIISRESGGNPQASNGTHWGLYQFSASTWAAYGGSPSSYGSASASEQQQVFNTAIARGGASNWTPYDGC